MTDLSMQLPPYLLTKLAQRGITDNEALLAAMQKDAVLRAEMHTFLAQHQDQITQWLIQDLLAVESDAALVALVQGAPFMLEEAFLLTVTQLAEASAKRGESGAADALIHRLAGLRRLRAQGDAENPAWAPEEQMGDMELLYQVVQAFLYAQNETTARQVFAEAPALLLSDDARQILDHGIEADNEQSRRRLAERKTLLRKLRRESKV